MRTHHVADVMRHEVRALDPERVEQAGNVLTLCLLVVAAFRTSGEPHPTQIGGDNRLVMGELRCERRPHVAGLTISVEQDDCWSLAADPRTGSCHSSGIPVL